MVVTRTGDEKNNFIKAVKTGGFLGIGKKFESWNIDGKGGNDTLIGGDKRDTLNGGTGIDVLEGRRGDDRYKVDDPRDVIIERSGEGKDVVFSTAFIYTLPDHVEVLDIDEPNRSTAYGFGNSLNNEIYGADTTTNDYLYGKAGNDLIAGFGNHDYLEGGLGNDTLEGGTGHDTLMGVDRNANNDVLEKDILLGGSGNDRFILGVRGNSFYDNADHNDFATIKDFRLDSDILQLAGSASDYQVSGNVLFHNGDLIGVFEGLSSISLQAVLDFNTDFVG